MRQKRIRKLHLSSQKGFHGLACSAFNCLWDSWVKDTFNRYINRLPRRKQCYQMLSPGERTGFTVRSKNRSKAILTSAGVGREEESPPRKSTDPERWGRKGKQEGRRNNHQHPHLAVARSRCLGPPFREKHSPEHFRNTAREVKWGAGIAARGPPYPRAGRAATGGMESRCSLSAPTLHSPP